MHIKCIVIHANIFRLEAICGIYSRSCFSASQNLKAAVTEGLARQKPIVGLKEQCVVSTGLAFRSGSDRRRVLSLLTL